MKLRGLRDRIRKIPFLESNLVMSPIQLIRFITGPLKGKSTATFIGPTGVGYVGIGTQAQMLGSSIGSFAMGTAFTIRLSQILASGNSEKRRRLLATAFTLQLVFNGTLCIAGLFAAQPLTAWIFGPAQPVLFIVLVLLSIPFISLINTYFQVILFAHGRYDLYARATALFSVLEALLVALGVIVFKTPGAFGAMLLGSMFWSSFLVFQILKLENGRDVFRLGFDREDAKVLIHSSSMILTTGIATYGVTMLLRILISRQLGVASNGSYQVVLALSAYYLPFLTNGIWARFFPRVSAKGISLDTISEWSDSLILTSALGCLAQLCLLVAPAKMITFFYTREFSKAAGLLPIQLIGDYFFLISQTCLSVTLGLDQRKTYAGLLIGYNLLYLLLAFMLIGRFGIQAVSIAYLVSNAVLAAYGLAQYRILSACVENGRKLSGRTFIYLLPPLLLVSLQATTIIEISSPLPRLLIVSGWVFCLVMAVTHPQLKKSILTTS